MLQRAAGELTRSGRGRPCGDKGFQQAIRHGGAAVDRKLDDILAGIGVGGAEEQGDGLVHLLPVQQVVAQHGGVTLGFGHLAPHVERCKDLFHNGVSVRPRYPHHGNAASAGGRCQCTDCLL